MKAKTPSITLCIGLVACCVILGMEYGHCLTNLNHSDLSLDAKTSSILKQREKLGGEWPYLFDPVESSSCLHTKKKKKDIMALPV